MRWLLPTLLLCGCTFLRSPAVPMPVVHHPAPADNANGLIVLLPGLGDGPSYYEANGFVSMIHAVNPRFDVIAADAHFGYYRAQSLIERLHDDVIRPIADRYEHIWLVGISLGGLGSAAYSIAHEEVIDGVIMLAPYMGDRDMIAEIDSAGGLRKWTPPRIEAIKESDRFFYEVWTWYHRYVDDPERRPKLFLGYGEEDKLYVQNSFVGEVLPERQHLRMPGGHKWTVWTPLFETLVKRALAPDQLR